MDYLLAWYVYREGLLREPHSLNRCCFFGRKGYVLWCLSFYSSFSCLASPLCSISMTRSLGFAPSNFL